MAELMRVLVLRSERKEFSWRKIAAETAPRSFRNERERLSWFETKRLANSRKCEERPPTSLKTNDFKSEFCDSKTTVWPDHRSGCRL
jgi:hypothetical protein